jgi:hypothetical protein
VPEMFGKAGKRVGFGTKNQFEKFGTHEEYRLYSQSKIVFRFCSF